MRCEQRCWRVESGWSGAAPELGDRAQLVLCFGDTPALAYETWRDNVAQIYPKAQVIGCSTAGSICGTSVVDGGVAATAIAFDHTTIQRARSTINHMDESRRVGEELAGQLDPVGLTHVLVLSDGLVVNGSALVGGLVSKLPAHVSVTGGLSADGERFLHTLVVCDGPAQGHQVVALGFYGGKLAVGCASLGGWDPFGPERLITKSCGNVLFELDGHSALALYKKYLGEHAAGLPATGLLFPLSVRERGRESGVVRTILSIDEVAESLTFAGDMPEGHYARLMKANFDRLVDGATGAARTTQTAIGSMNPDLAILISCVGRRMVLKQRTEEEIEAVREVLGDHTMLTGFYSYGEISPMASPSKCELHNQTMTITAFKETA